MTIGVLLVDDHEIVRDGLRSLLSRQDDIVVAGEASNGREALSVAEATRPDVVVMDISMSDLNGIEATRQLLEQDPNARVISLSMHSDRRYVTEMLAAGAYGYVVKDSAFDELAQAIREVHEGRRFLSQRVSQTVIEDYMNQLNGTTSQHKDASGERKLSPRELQVLQLIAVGLSTKEIAAKLQLSVKTVETHRRQVMEKLSIFTIAGLIKYAIKSGLASLDD